jgi:alpha-tubulin suppressor-like RCC1 family protein
MGTGGTSTTEVSAPVAVATSQRFVSIDGAYGTTCALTAAGRAFCWGTNHYGQGGDGTLVDRYVPTPVTGGYVFESISVGANVTCGLTRRTVYCWGFGGWGQLGDGQVGAAHWENPLPAEILPPQP